MAEELCKKGFELTHPPLRVASWGITVSKMILEASRVASPLAAQLLRRAETLSPDAYYRLARIVARVLVSRRLRQRRKWCDLACALAAFPEVEERLVRQAMGWLGKNESGSREA